MGGNLDVASFVIETTLLATIDTADGQLVGLVEEGDRLVVLAFPVLNHELGVRVIRIDGQTPACADCVGISEQPVEGVLTETGLTQDLVAEVKDVRCVAHAPGCTARAVHGDQALAEAMERLLPALVKRHVFVLLQVLTNPVLELDGVDGTFGLLGAHVEFDAHGAGLYHVAESRERPLEGV